MSKYVCQERLRHAMPFFRYHENWGKASNAPRTAQIKILNGQSVGSVTQLAYSCGAPSLSVGLSVGLDLLSVDP